MSLDRIADALFLLAKATKRQAEASEAAVKQSARMLEIQEANLAVTKQLEEALTRQSGG